MRRSRWARQGGFITLSSTARESLSVLADGPYRTLEGLADLADEDTGLVKLPDGPSGVGRPTTLRELATELGRARNTITAHLRALEKVGQIDVVMGKNDDSTTVVHVVDVGYLLALETTSRLVPARWAENVWPVLPRTERVLTILVATSPAWLSVSEIQPKTEDHRPHLKVEKVEKVVAELVAWGWIAERRRKQAPSKYQGTTAGRQAIVDLMRLPVPEWRQYEDGELFAVDEDGELIGSVDEDRVTEER